MLIDEIKKRMFAAMKAGNTVEKEVLRTAIGEVTSTGQEASDERVIAVIKKLIKSNEETLNATEDEAQRTTLEQELEILRAFTPRTLSLDEIVVLLKDVKEQIRAAGNDGQATGIAMKTLRTNGAQVEGKDVANAVKQLRS